MYICLQRLPQICFKLFLLVIVRTYNYLFWNSLKNTKYDGFFFGRWYFSTIVGNTILEKCSLGNKIRQDYVRLTYTCDISEVWKRKHT